jgi:hypothetical protein
MNAITKGYQDVPMTRRRAQLLEEYASKLADMLEAAPNDKDLAEWVQSKIDRAAAAIQSAYHYLDQDDESELEKARVLKYDYRRPSKTRFNKKTGKREWDYFYTKKHGARVTRGAFEAGAAFRMTWKGRKGHFHIHHVKGDQVFITHDSRPDMEPIPVQADELRALLERQHKREVDQHLKRKTREVEEIKRRAHRGGLGLALHRLRQAAAQAGVSLPEQYQRKPKKTRAKVAETAREVETPERGEPVQDERFEYGLELEALAKRAGLKYSEQGVARSVDARVVRDNEPHVLISAMHLQRVYPKLTQQQVDDFKARAIAYLKEFTGDDLTEDIQHTAQSNQTRSRMIYKELDAAISHIINEVGNGGREERKATLQAVKMLAEWREDTQTTPRDQLTSTAQQIIEDANQEHGERHDEHQEITRFELGEHTHTKTGAKLYTAKQTERVDRDEYFRRVEIAKKHNGRYERRYVRGFVFKTAEDARAFALEVEGAAQEAPETSAETVTPHDEHPGADNFETMPEVESAPRSRALFREKVEELKRLEDELIDFTNSLARPQGLTKEQEKDILDKMQAEIAKKRDELTEGFTRPQSSGELEARLKSFLPTLKGFDYSRVEGYRLYIDKEHKAPLRAQIKELMGTGLNVSPANLKNYGLNVAGSFKDMARLLFALENEAKGTPRGHLTPSRLYGMDHETVSWHDIVDATGQGDLSGRKLKDLDLSEIQTSIDFYVSILESYRDDPKTYKRFRRQTDKQLRDLKRYVRTRKAEGRIKGESPPAPPESKPAPTPTVDLTQQEKRDALLSLMPTTPREQLTATAREVTQGADNFETMPEVEARDLKAYKRVRRLARKAEKLDRATGRRTNESKKADQSLAQAARSLLETEFADLPSTQEISRKRQTRLTPEEARKATITGALNKLERNQTASRAGSAAQAYENRSEARAILEREMRDRLEAAAPLPTPRDRGPQIEEPPRTTIYDDVPLAKPRPEPRAQTVDKYTAAIYSERLDTKPAFKYSDARSAIERYQDGATSTKADRELLEETAGDLSPFINRLLDEHRPVGLGIKAHDARYQRYKDYADHAGFTIPSQMELTAPGRSNFEIIKKIGLHLLSSVNLTETSTRGDLTKELARSFAQYDEATRDKQPTAPARQALTETTERVTSDQTAEQATTRATPRPSEETLRGSGELDETVRANLQDRAQYLLRMPEDTTKTGMRSKAQKARDGELLLIHRRLQSDAQERLGPTAPRFADYSQLIGMPRADQPENAETRAQFRTALKDAIRELEQATSGRAESAAPAQTPISEDDRAVERLLEVYNSQTKGKGDARTKKALRGLSDQEFDAVARAFEDYEEREHAINKRFTGELFQIARATSQLDFKISNASSAEKRALRQERKALAEREAAIKTQRQQELDAEDNAFKDTPFNITEVMINDERFRRQEKAEKKRQREQVKAEQRRRKERTKAPRTDTQREGTARQRLLARARGQQVTKSARPLITYRAQLIQTVERLTA